jgi:hypothetical protein
MTYHLELGSVLRDWMAFRASTALLTALMASRAELKELLVVVVVVVVEAPTDDSGTGSEISKMSCQCIS